jgi:hypothetical protein
MNAQVEVKELITTWAATRPDEIISEPRNGFFSTDIVVDAYKAGVKKGKDSNIIEQIRTSFYSKANILSEAISEAATKLFNKDYAPLKIFISHNINESKVLLTFDPETYRDINFINYSYPEIKVIEDKYYTAKLNLNFSFMGDSAELNYELLHCDGYMIGYDFSIKKPIEFYDERTREAQ